MFGCAWCRYILYKVWIEISNFTKPTTKLCSTGRQEAARATNEWRAKPKDKSAQASAANAKRRAEQQKKEAELKQREARS